MPGKRSDTVCETFNPACVSSWNICQGMRGTFHKLFTGFRSSLAATAERLGTHPFRLKKKGYETDKFNMPETGNKA